MSVEIANHTTEDLSFDLRDRSIDREDVPEEWHEMIFDAENFIISGPASVEIVDRTGQEVKMSALEAALDRYMEPEDVGSQSPGVITMEHAEPPIGRPLTRWETDDGEVYETRVEEDSFHLVANIDGETTKGKEARLRILNDDFDGYSITIFSREEGTRDSDGARVTTECDLHAVTLGAEDKLMNPQASFEFVDAKTGSFVDRIVGRFTQKLRSEDLRPEAGGTKKPGEVWIGEERDDLPQFRDRTQEVQNVPASLRSITDLRDLYDISTLVSDYWDGTRSMEEVVGHIKDIAPDAKEENIRRFVQTIADRDLEAGGAMQPLDPEDFDMTSEEAEEIFEREEIDMTMEEAQEILDTMDPEEAEELLESRWTLPHDVFEDAIEAIDPKSISQKLDWEDMDDVDPDEYNSYYGPMGWVSPNDDPGSDVGVKPNPQPSDQDPWVFGNSPEDNRQIDESFEQQVFEDLNVSDPSIPRWYAQQYEDDERSRYEVTKGIKNSVPSISTRTQADLLLEAADPDKYQFDTKSIVSRAFGDDP